MLCGLRTQAATASSAWDHIMKAALARGGAVRSLRGAAHARVVVHVEAQQVVESVLGHLADSLRRHLREDLREKERKKTTREGEERKRRKQKAKQRSGAVSPVPSPGIALVHSARREQSGLGWNSFLSTTRGTTRRSCCSRRSETAPWDPWPVHKCLVAAPPAPGSNTVTFGYPMCCGVSAI